MKQGFSLVELSIVLVKRIRHSVARVFAKAKTVNPESCREKIPAFAGMTTKSGFSLVELSIVLVILGLLTGGILTGQNLIRAAELRSVVTEFQGFQTAVHSFRDKYFAYPGDMANATDFWDYPASTPANCPATAGTGTETCNGNGDGEILRTTFNADEYNEEFLFWQHLANAGLIEGNYTGIAGASSDTHAVLRQNIPVSKLSNAGWSVWDWNAPGGNAVLYSPFDYNRGFLFGAANAAGHPSGPVLTSEEAWNIDTKVDDGRPGYGKVMAWYWDNLCADATASDDFDSDYRLNDETRQCAILFVNAF